MLLDFCELETFRSLSSFFSRKPLETESLAELQFVIDSCCLVSQSNYLDNSKNDCDRLIISYFIRQQMQAADEKESLVGKY